MIRMWTVMIVLGGALFVWMLYELAHPYTDDEEE